MGKARAEKLKRREQREQIATTRFWHGGVAGLEPGAFLLSPNITRDPHSVWATGLQEARADRVYFTTDIELARVFAAMVMQGVGASAVYEVRPLGEVEVDPDYRTVGRQSIKALVIDVVERDVVLTDAERGRRLQPYTLYTDGRHIHDESGRLQLSESMARHGLTQAFLDSTFPLWVPFEVAARQLDSMRLPEAGSPVRRASSFSRGTPEQDVTR